MSYFGPVKKCSKCGVDKSKSAEFRTSADTRDGYRPECRECERAARAVRRARRPDLCPPDVTLYDRVEADLLERFPSAAAVLADAGRPLVESLDLGTRVYVVISDVHVPYECKNATGAVCDLIRDLQPDGLVVNGDFLDLLEVSRHATGSVAKLEGKRITETFAAGNRLLDALDAAGGEKMREKWYLAGNHEDRIRRWIQSGDNAAFLGDEGVSIEHRLRLRERGYAWEPDPHGDIRLGHLAVTHGRFTPKYHANKHLDTYRHSVLYGHTHVPQVIYGPGLTQQVGIGTGHLADPTSEAMEYAPRPNAWCQGFAVVYLWPSGEFNVQLVNFWRGTFHYGARRYGRPVTGGGAK